MHSAPLRDSEIGPDEDLSVDEEIEVEGPIRSSTNSPLFRLEVRDDFSLFGSTAKKFSSRAGTDPRAEHQLSRGAIFAELRRFNEQMKG